MTEIEKLRQDAAEYQQLYPAGTRIILESMSNDPDPVPAGTMGTITHIDHLSNIYVDCDNGRTLSICPQVDKFRTLTPEEQAFDKSLINFIDRAIPTIKDWADLVTYRLPNSEYLLVIFADKTDESDGLYYVVEPNQIINGKETIVGDCITCDFRDNEQLLKACRRAIANTFPNSCRKKL